MTSQSPNLGDDFTPTAKLIWYYLYARRLEGKGAATRKEIMGDLNLDASICRKAINLLRKKEIILAQVMFRAEGTPEIAIQAV